MSDRAAIGLRAARLRQHHLIELAVARTGRTGGAEKFASALAFKATLESSQDKLVFDLQAEKAGDNGVETANRQFGGVDYSSFFTPDNVWYARTSVEKDSIKALDLRSSTAFGIGRKLIKKETQDLEARIGLSYLIPGILRVGDMGHLAACVAPRPLLLINGVDGRRRPVEGPQWEAATEFTGAVYRLHRRLDALRRVRIPREEVLDCLTAWLTQVYPCGH